MLTMVVPGKGAAYEQVISRVVEWIDALGYGKIRLRCDGEPSTLALQEEIKLKRRAETIPEVALKGEKQSNGAAEQAVREAEGMMRTLKEHIEYKIRRKLSPNEPMVSWIVHHVGTLVTRVKLGPDGKTAYHRIEGKPSAVPMVPWVRKSFINP